MSVSQPVRDAYAAMAKPYIDLCEGGDWPDDDDDVALVERHLTGLDGPVLDLGCGPGHWTARLHSLGADVTGIDLVPEFIAHARAAHPESTYRLGTMTALDVADHSVAGLLSWYSTIHLPPAELDGVLAEFRRVLSSSGVLVVGFFASADVVAPFDHKVVTAYRWPVDVLARRLAAAGFVEVERRQHQVAGRPDRRYAALVACGSRGQVARPLRKQALRVGPDHEIAEQADVDAEHREPPAAPGIAQAEPQADQHEAGRHQDAEREGEPQRPERGQDPGENDGGDRRQQQKDPVVPTDPPRRASFGHHETFASRRSTYALSPHLRAAPAQGGSGARAV